MLSLPETLSDVSPGQTPRPSLSAFSRQAGKCFRDCVAGADAPAFVERSLSSQTLGRVILVSPGQTPRPSLSAIEEQVSELQRSKCRRGRRPGIAKIDDYSTGGEIGVKMTSAIGNLAGHPLTLVRLFKSTDYACPCYGSVGCGKAASPPPFFKTQRVSPGWPSERRAPYTLLFSKGFGVSHIIPASFPTGRIRPVFRPLILCSARILRSCRTSSEPRPIGLIHLA